MRNVTLDAAQIFVGAVSQKYDLTGSEKLEILGAEEFLKWFESSSMPGSYRKTIWGIVGEAVKEKVVRAVFARKLKPKKGGILQDVAVLVAVPGYHLGEVGIGQAVVEASSNDDGNEEEEDEPQFKSCSEYWTCTDWGWLGMQCMPQVWIVRADEDCPSAECEKNSDCESDEAEEFSSLAEQLSS